MKSFNLEGLACATGGEYVLGYKDLHSHACYLIYGFIEHGDEGRLVRPGTGYEEILCAIGGSLKLQTSRGDITLEQGHAIHITEHESFFVSNPGDSQVAYVIAGGRKDCASSP